MLLDHLLNIVGKSENSEAAYSDWKDLTKKTFIKKKKKKKKKNAYEIVIYSKNDGYQRGLASMVNKAFDKTGLR